MLFRGLPPGLQEFLYLKMNSLISSADNNINYECLESVVVPVSGRLSARADSLRAAREPRTHRPTPARRTSTSSPAHYSSSVWIQPPPRHQFQQSCLRLCHLAEGSDGMTLFHSIPPGVPLLHLGARQRPGNYGGSSQGLLPFRNRKQGREASKAGTAGRKL